MAKAIDASGIHFKMLNQSKGPAVQGPRAQADRLIYARSINNIIGSWLTRCFRTNRSMIHAKTIIVIIVKIIAKKLCISGYQ